MNPTVSGQRRIYIPRIPFYTATRSAELGVSGKNSLRRLPQSLPVLDKTDNPDDADPGRQVGAFLTADSWKRFRLPGQVRFLPHRRRTSECWERIS